MRNIFLILSLFIFSCTEKNVVERYNNGNVEQVDYYKSQIKVKSKRYYKNGKLSEAITFIKQAKTINKKVVIWVTGDHFLLIPINTSPWGA